MARISFRQGIVRTHPTAMQFTSGNTVILLDGQTSPVQLNFADGPDDDYLWEEATEVNPPWTNLPSVQYWLYIDINAITSVRTFGTTTVQPLEQPNTPISPAVDQHWFDTRSSYTLMKVWDGSKWVPKIRLFMGRVDGLTITPYDTGTQAGLTDTVSSGRILYDDENKTKPIKKYDRRGRGKFITTESIIFAQFSNITGFKVAQSLVEGQAIEPIPEYSVVSLRGGEYMIGLAKNGTAGGVLPGPFVAIGIATEDFATGEVHTFATTGYLTDDNFNWTEDPGTYLFVGPTGELTTTVPQAGSIQRIGVIINTFTIQIDIQPIIYYSTT